MSLSKIGKLTSAFSSFKNNPLDLTNMATALASVGNVDNAAKYLVKINKQNGNFLGENAMAVLLSKAYRSSGINQEMAMGSINNALANSSKFSMGGMLGSLSAVGTGIATMFESIAPVIIPLIIAAVAAKAGKMAWDNFATNTAAKKQYQTSSKAYQEAASERDSVQSEYDSNKERIQELRAKANRTVDESKELSNLQSQNDLLNSQLSVKNQIADTAQKQAALDAKTALEKGSYRSGGLLNMDYDSDLEHASDLMHEIQVNQYRKSRLEKNRSDYSDSYWSDYQKEEREIANYDKTINSQKSDLSDLMTTISDTSQDFWDEQGNLVDESTRDTANKVKELANDYTSITGVSDIDSKMNNLFARSQFKDVKDQLLDIGKKQGSKGIESKIDEIDGLKSALDDAGISIDDFTSELMAMADPDAKNLEGIKENLKDIFGEIQDTDGNSLYDFFKDKSNKDIEGYYDYFLNQGLNPQTSDYTWKKEDIENSYNDYLKSKEKTNPESTIFSSLFKNSAEDTATDLDTITDNFQTDMSNIKSSMDSIKSGTFQNSDITDLIQQFPELATETDNLQQGLQNLAFDKASDAIGKIRDSVKDVTDPKQLAAADKYVQSIMDTMDLSGFDMSNAKSAILGNLTKNLADKHMASVTTPNLVNQLMSEYGNDEIAVQAIMKLSLDPSMANADLDTWKSKIEDTKVQIQLDTSAKNLDNLSKELTRLQTDASDQQTRLNNKSAYNMKATASDYTNLIENGDKQIENLNNQIKEYQNNIDALKNSKGLSPLSDEDNEQIKQWQDQIQASQMSIENMKASQADWTKTAFNLPVTDMQNTVTALTSAISEMQTETGLTSDTSVAANTAAIGTLNGTGDGSVKKAVADAVAKIVADAPEAYDTLKEISDWISTHTSDAATMNSQIKTNKEDITKLKTLIGTLPESATSKDIVSYIAEYVSKALADSDLSQYAKAADLEAAVGRIDALEKKLPTLEAADKKNAEDITAVKGRMDTAEGKITAVEKDLAKSEVGLGNVDNTADATKSVKYAISAGSASSAAALTSNAGSSTQPVYFSGGKPVACSYTLGKSVPADALFTDHTYGNMKGATSSSAGSAGLVPAPNIGEQLKFLRADGTWVIPTNTTYSVGTSSYLGITKLYTETGSATDGTMTQNAITTALNGKSATGHTHNYAGSSSAGGNANAAVKLATARKIGSASFDGTADITLSQMGLNVPVEITKADYLAKKKAGTLNANTYYNVIDEYDSVNVINDSSVTANSTFSSTKSEKTYAKKSTLVNTTLTASKWTGSSAPYSYVLSVSGVTSSNIVEIDYASNASSAAIEAYQNAMLADGGQTTNQITIKATEKPTVDIPITIVIRNDL